MPRVQTEPMTRPDAPVTRRLLFVSDVPFDVASSGNRRVMMNRVFAFRQYGYEVDLCLQGGLDPRQRRRLHEQGIGTLLASQDLPGDVREEGWYAALRDRSPWVIRRLTRAVRAFFSRRLGSQGAVAPRGFETFVTPGTIRAFETLLRERKPDVVFVNYAYMGYLLKDRPLSAVTVVETHDVLHTFESIYAQSGWGGTNYLRTTWEEEAAELARFNVILALTPADHAQFCRMAPNSTVLTCLPAQHIPDPRPAPRRTDRAEKNVLFVGTVHPPNLDGATRLIERIWPRVLSRLPEAKLIVAGDICNRFHGQSPKGVTFAGFVEDLPALFARCDVFVSPITFGTGIKIKVQEAMANGVPAVISPHSAIGFEQGEGRAFLVADSDEDFAAAVTDLLRDGEKGRKLGEAGLVFAETHFAPVATIAPLIEEIERRIEGRTL